MTIVIESHYKHKCADKEGGREGGMGLLFPDGGCKELRSEAGYLLYDKLQSELGLRSEGKVQRCNVMPIFIKLVQENTFRAFLRYLSTPNFSTASEIPLTLQHIHASFLHEVLQ